MCQGASGLCFGGEEGPSARRERRGEGSWGPCVFPHSHVTPSTAVTRVPAVCPGLHPARAALRANPQSAPHREHAQGPAPKVGIKCDQFSTSGVAFSLHSDTGKISLGMKRLSSCLNITVV